MFLTNLTLQIHRLQCHWVVGNYWNCIPNILRTLLLEKCNTASVFSTKHRLHNKLEFLFTSWRNCQFLYTLAIKKVSLNSKINRSLLIGIFDNNLFLDDLLGLAFDFNMLLCEWLLSISNDLILEVIKSQGITHDKLGFSLTSPPRLKSYREITNAVLFDWERWRVGTIYDEIIAIFRSIWKPSNLNVPISLSIVHYWKVLCYFTSSWNIHL